MKLKTSQKSNGHSVKKLFFCVILMIYGLCSTSCTVYVGVKSGDSTENLMLDAENMNLSMFASQEELAVKKTDGAKGEERRKENRYGIRLKNGDQLSPRHVDVHVHFKGDNKMPYRLNAYPVTFITNRGERLMGIIEKIANEEDQIMYKTRAGEHIRSDTLSNLILALTPAFSASNKTGKSYVPEDWKADIVYRMQRYTIPNNQIERWSLATTGENGQITHYDFDQVQTITMEREQGSTWGKTLGFMMAAAVDLTVLLVAGFIWVF